MKKYIIYFLIIILVIIVTAGWWYLRPAQPGMALVGSATYLCKDQKTIDANFYQGVPIATKPGEMPIPNGSVFLKLSDGRNLTLPQTISASGIRYANGDESVVFWSKGDTAFVTEQNGSETYSGCTANTIVGWKTYRNEEGAYSFEYPVEWNAATNKYNSKNALFGPGATNESGYGGVEFLGTLSSGQSLKDFVNKFNSGVEAGSISETETTINGQIAVISILPKAATEPTEVKSVSFLKDGKVFNVYLMYKTNFTKYPEDKERLTIFNQIFSTFRFLD